MRPAPPRRTLGDMAPIVVYPPDETGGRRVRARGQILGTTHNVYELLDLLEQVGLDPADVPDLIEWRGGGSYEWTPNSG